MYKELVNRLREESEIERWLQPHSANETPKLLDDAADAIETLIKGQKNLAEQVAKWQAEAVKGDCEAWLSEQDKPRWISVTERLPEESWERVIAYTDDGTVMTLPAIKLRNGYVRYWMPLPEPPKEE